MKDLLRKLAGGQVVVLARDGDDAVEELAFRDGLWISLHWVDSQWNEDVVSRDTALTHLKLLVAAEARDRVERDAEIEWLRCATA